MVRLTRSFAVSLFIFSLLVFVAPAQDLTSRVDGVVVDQSGGRIPGATVTLNSVETNISRTAISDSEGLYVFPQVRSGAYRVSAELSGFKKAVVEGVQVEVGVPANVRLELSVGG